MILKSIFSVLFLNCCLLPRFSFGQRIYFEDENPTEDNWDCLTEDNQKGLCKDYELCTTQSKNAALCGYKESQNSVICCPITMKLNHSIKITKTKTVNKTAPIVVKEVTVPTVDFECGTQGLWRKKRSVEIPEYDYQPDVQFEVYNGYNSVYYPWMALFGRTFRGKNYFFCNGVLINKQFVLTAAHCVLDPTPFFVRLGEYNFESTDDYYDTLTVNVKDIIFNPLYKLKIGGHHDLALVKLDTEVSITNHVRPICLPWGTPSNAELISKYVTISGWGAKYFGGPATPILQEAVIEVFDPKVCHASYSTLPDFKTRFPEGMTMRNTVCAGNKVNGTDACKGDSGGPLTLNEEGKWFLAGIVSQGYGCGNIEFPGLYVPIRNLDYLQWIKSIAFESN